MAEDEGVQVNGIGVAGEGELGKGVGEAAIVVAEDEVGVELGVGEKVKPAIDHLVYHASFRVEKVAKDEEVLGLGAIARLLQALQGGLVHLARNGDAEVLKGFGFAQVNIGNEEGLVVGQVDGFFGEQGEGLPCEDDGFHERSLQFVLHCATAALFCEKRLILKAPFDPV